MEKSYEFKVYLGRTKDTHKEVYLNGFDWACNWYWSGGKISTKNMSTHFNNCFLDIVDDRGHCLGNFTSPWYKGDDPENAVIVSNGCSIWEDISFFLNSPQYSKEEWWRIKDLYKQFYIYQKAAEAFQYGGHCTDDKRNPLELNKDMANKINDHIEYVIIPEIIKALKVNNEN